MARQDIDISSFVGGEISPNALGRIDEEKYYASAVTQQNMVTMPQGGMVKRPGTLWVTPVKNQGIASRLRRFIFSTVQAYMMEWTPDSTVRVMKNRAPILNQQSVTGAADNGGGLIRLTLASVTGLYTGNAAVVAGVGGTVEANGAWTISNVSLQATVTGASGGAVTQGQIELALSGSIADWDPAQPVTVAGCDGTMDCNGTFPWVAIDSSHIVLIGTLYGGQLPTMGTVTAVSKSKVDLQGSAFVNAYTSGGNLTAAVEIPVPYQPADLASLWFFQSDDVLFIFHPNYPPAQLNRLSHTQWVFVITTWLDGPYLDPIVSNLPTLQGSGNLGAVLSVAAPPTGAGTDYQNPGGTIPPGQNSATGGWINVSTITAGLVTLTISSTAGVNASEGNQGVGFLPTDVGRMLRAQRSFNFLNGTGGLFWYWYRIRKYVSATEVVAAQMGMVLNGAYFGNIMTSSSGGHATDQLLDYTAEVWQLGKWSGSTGYPWIGTIFGQRIIAIGTNNEPNAVEGSVLADYFNFAPTQSMPYSPSAEATDANAFSYLLADNEVNGARWVSAAGAAQLAQLGIGTEGGEEIMSGGSQGATISPLSVQAYRETVYGSIANAEPQRIGKVLLFAGLNGRKLHEWQYQWQVFGYLGPDLAVWSDHITLSSVTDPDTGDVLGIIQLSYQQQPHSVVWAILADFSLIALTYQQDQKVVAWHRHRLGGNYYGGAPLVESMDVIPSEDGTYSELWLEVARTIGPAGSETVVRSVEVMTAYFDGQQQDRAVQLDAALQTPLVFPAANLTAIVNLENAALKGVKNAAFRGDATVTASAAIFSAGSVNSVIRVNGGAILVTGFVDTEHVTGPVVSPLLSTAPAANGSWSCTPRYGAAFAHPLVISSSDPIDVYADGFDQGVSMPGAAGPSLTGTLNTIGLPYDTSYVSVPFEPARAAAVSSRGKIKSIKEIYLRLANSGPFQFGKRVTDDQTFEIKDKLELSEQPPPPILGWAGPLYSGIRRINPQGSSDREGQIAITQFNAYPLTVLALSATGSVDGIPGPAL